MTHIGFLRTTIACLVLNVAAAAQAETVPFRCDLRDDGRTVHISVSNPSRDARSCIVSCRFATATGRSDAQIMCAHMVEANAVDAAMCTKDSGGVTLTKQTHGAADCNKP